MISEVDVKDLGCELPVKEYNIVSLNDIFKLTEDQFERFIPDLREMFKLSKIDMSKIGLSLSEEGFVWCDDNIVGISSVYLSSSFGNRNN